MGVNYWAAMDCLDPTIGTSEMTVFHVLSRYANGCGVCWPTYTTIIRQSRLARATVSRAIKNLRSAGVITTTLKDKQRILYRLPLMGEGLAVPPSGPDGQFTDDTGLPTNRFTHDTGTVTIPVEHEPVSQVNRFSGDTGITVEPDRFTGETGTGSLVRPELIQETNPRTQETPPIVPPPGDVLQLGIIEEIRRPRGRPRKDATTTHYTPAFNKAFNAYPNVNGSRGGKAGASCSFAELVSVEKMDPEELVRCAERYAATVKPDSFVYHIDRFYSRLVQNAGKSGRLFEDYMDGTYTEPQSELRRRGGKFDARTTRF